MEEEVVEEPSAIEKEVKVVEEVCKEEVSSESEVEEAAETVEVNEVGQHVIEEASVEEEAPKEEEVVEKAIIEELEAKLEVSEAPEVVESPVHPKKTSSKNKKKGGAFATPSRRDCANCGQAEGTVPGVLQHKPCGKCKITFYCGTECQKKHWKAHKKNCMTPEERSVAKAKAEAAATSSSAAAAAEERDPDNECAICFDDLSDSPSPALPCSHRFHASCVDELRKAGVEEVCPLCRAKLPATAEKMFDDAMSIGYPIVKLVKSGRLSWGSLNREQQRRMQRRVRPVPMTSVLTRRFIKRVEV